ncbi:hypothetical protein [Mycolicibacterium sediminis]|uniref:Secreted protein n=1 Tax=Mycolicibacterium sediminis TaxID=1286180 RepID=A0A7I7QN52_9MYCO|nr:hypothetical protein [Mycolicibacterium sediminis]BBY27829.1 hypothetical protein MSEDJ_19250 [Mycolicibacterium sediminis]
MRRPTIAAALVAGAALFAAPLAIAAPTAGPADATVAHVTAKEAATAGGACTVTQVQPLQVRELPRGGTGVGPAAALAPAVHVGVQC